MVVTAFAADHEECHLKVVVVVVVVVMVLVICSSILWSTRCSIRGS